jgi:hypothetical protein
MTSEDDIKGLVSLTSFVHGYTLPLYPEENINQLPRDGKKKSDFTREGGGGVV